MDKNIWVKVYQTIIPLLFLSSLAAEAPASDKSLAKEKFAEGIAFARQENYLEALHAFEESYRLWPSPATQINIGMANKALYRYVEAIAAFENFLAEAGKKAGRRKKKDAEKALNELLQLVGTLRLKNPPDGAELRINGDLRATLPLASPLRMNPGQHAIEIRLEGYETLETKIQIASGAETTVLAALSPAMTILKVDCGGKTATVHIDGEAKGQCPYAGKVPPGPHELTVSGPGFQSVKKQIQAVSGSTLDIPVALLPEMTGENKPAAQADEDSPMPKILGWTAVGLGVASAGVGGYFTYRYVDHANDVAAIADEAAKHVHDELKYNELQAEWKAAKETFEEEQAPKDIAGIAVGFGLGAVLLTSGVVLLIVNRKKNKKNKSPITMRPAPGGITVVF